MTKAKPPPPGARQFLIELIVIVVPRGLVTASTLAS